MGVCSIRACTVRRLLALTPDLRGSAVRCAFSTALRQTLPVCWLGTGILTDVINTDFRVSPNRGRESRSACVANLPAAARHDFDARLAPTGRWGPDRVCHSGQSFSVRQCHFPTLHLARLGPVCWASRPCAGRVPGRTLCPQCAPHPVFSARSRDPHILSPVYLLHLSRCQTCARTCSSEGRIPALRWYIGGRHGCLSHRRLVSPVARDAAYHYGQHLHPLRPRRHVPPDRYTMIPRPYLCCSVPHVLPPRDPIHETVRCSLCDPPHGLDPNMLCHVRRRVR